MKSQRRFDCAILGGGIVGLSIALELVQRGRTVVVGESEAGAPIASWAASGTLPPPARLAIHDPLEQLRALSHDLYPEWCEQLARDTGIDVEYAARGGYYIGRHRGESIGLQAQAALWQLDGVEVAWWKPSQLATQEPQLRRFSDHDLIAYLPAEASVRPPRLLSALRAALARHGVERLQWTELPRGELRHGELVGLQTTTGRIVADHYCFAGGPWTRAMLQPLGIELAMEPRRGQIVCWKLDTPWLTRPLNEGPRYLLARNDGHLLAGSTVEDVGFDHRTTPAAIAELIGFAHDLLPQLASTIPVAEWAGLRPMTIDGLPYLGRLPGCANGCVATGHFRSGIHCAPATARLISQLLVGETPALSLQPFSVAR